MSPLQIFCSLVTGLAIGLSFIWIVCKVSSRLAIHPVKDDQKLDRDAAEYARIQADTRLHHALREQDMDTLRIMARKGMELHYREVYLHHALKGEILKPVKLVVGGEPEATQA